MKKPLVLRCYAEGRPGKWAAICLDLDIAVDGDSLITVVKSLEEAINQYCEYIASLPEADQQRLLRRRVPLALRIQFFWYLLRSLWNRTGGGDNPKSRAEFVLNPDHCHA